MVSILNAHPKITGAIVFLIVFSTGEYMARLEAEVEREALRGQALAKASTVRANVEASLNSTIYLGTGLSGYLALEPRLDDETVERLLASVYQHGRNIRNIGLAPDNRIAYIYPRIGNEAAIGMEYNKIPSQWPAVQRAMEERTTVVVGPIELAQGGYGIVTRTPVYLADGRYWGVVSVVVDAERLLESVERSFDVQGIVWALRAKLESTDDLFVYGDSALFASDGVVQQIALPGGTWDLAILPSRPGPRSVLSFRLLNGPVALIITLLVFMVLRERVKVHHMAVHDTLTGLPNRRLLFERLEQRIALATRYESRFCVVYVDLNRFKPINDTYGHRCGDRVLSEIAERMEAVVRASDTVARVGGDEFVILLPDTPDRAGALAVMANVRRAIETPIETDKGILSVSASMGVVCYPEDGMDPEALLGSADSAMYVEKEHTYGRGDGDPASEE